MKYALIFVLIFLTGFAGCDSNTKNREKNESVRSAEKSEAKEETEQAHEEEKALIAEADTKLLDKSENRTENIKLASSAIDGFVIAPGETFSFNEAVGERSEERGYKKAPILIYEEREYDFGGGVCQLSTTLYQAAKAAGLEIEEHHSHRKEVSYAKKGEDAAVDYGVLDLKLRNNTASEIVIYTGVYDDCVAVQIWK